MERPARDACLIRHSTILGRIDAILVAFSLVKVPATTYDLYPYLIRKVPAAKIQDSEK